MNVEDLNQKVEELKDLFLKKFDDLSVTIKQNQEFYLNELKIVNDKASLAITLAEANEARTQEVEREMEDMKKVIKRLENKISEQEESIDDQVNRT